MLHFDIYLSLFLVGLLGSTHCIGMCGGLQQLFINMAPEQGRVTLLIYHIGRLSSYVIIMLLVATLLSRFAAQTAGFVPYAVVIRLIAAGVIIWIGVNHFIRIPLPHSLSIATGKMWQSLRGLAAPFLPPKNRWQVLIVGMVWGWLPCSLVYSALAIALSAGSVAGSAVAMLCFGLGTVPALFGVGFLTQRLQQNPQYQQIFAAVLIAIGVYALLGVLV